MKKLLFAISSFLLLTASLHADNNKTMTDEEFMKQFTKLDKEVKEEKAKNKALDKLEKTVDELANKLKVDK